MATAPPHQRYTLEEYLDLDEKSGFKSEYHDGEIFPGVDEISPPIENASFDHAAIGSNVSAQLNSVLRSIGSDCRVLDSSAWVYQPSTDSTVHPDITVVCGRPQFKGGTQIILNLLLLVEVLSPSTRNYDRGDKFDGYASIASFLEYVVIEQGKVQVELRTRQADSWILTKQTDPASHIHLASLGVSISVRSIYEGVSWLARSAPGAS